MRYVFSLVPSSCFCFSSTTLSVYNDACVHFVCYFYDSEQFTIKLQKWSSGATLSLIIHCLPSTFLLTSTWSWCVSPETLHLDPMHEAQGSVTLWRSVITITFHSVCTWAQFYLLCHYAKALWANTPSRLSHVRFKPSTVAQLHGLAKHQSTLIFVLQWCCLCRCGSPCHVCTMTSFPLFHLQSERSVTGRGCWTCSSVGDNTGQRFASSYVTIELRESLVSFHQASFFFSPSCTQRVFLFLRRLPLKIQCIEVAPGMPAPATTPSLPFIEKLEVHFNCLLRLKISRPRPTLLNFWSGILAADLFQQTVLILAVGKSSNEPY